MTLTQMNVQLANAISDKAGEAVISETGVYRFSRAWMGWRDSNEERAWSRLLRRAVSSPTGGAGGRHSP